MSRLLILLSTGAIWLVMMIALVERELRPYLRLQAPPTYRALLRDLDDPVLTEVEVRIAANKVGDLKVLLSRVGGSYEMRTVLRFQAIVPSPIGDRALEFPILIKRKAEIDSLFQLKKLVWLFDGFLQAEVQGHVSGGRMRLSYKVRHEGRKLASGEETLDFPYDTILGDVFEPFPGGGRLYIGKRWRTPVIDADLTGMKLSYLYAAVTARETFRWKDQDIDGLRVEVRKKPTEDDLPTHIFFCDEEGAAYLQRVTYQGLEYDFVLIGRRTLSRQEKMDWENQWEPWGPWK